MRPIVAAAAGVVGISIGFWFGQRSTSPPDPTSPPILSAPVAVGRSDTKASCDDVEAERSRLAAELQRALAKIRLLEALNDDLGEALDGEPVEWPDQPPELFRRERVEATLEEAIRSCQLPVDLLGLECAEPPCIGVMRDAPDGQTWQSFGECSAWSSVYLGNNTVHSEKVVCADGSEERVLLVQPDWLDLRESVGDEEWKRRNNARRERIVSSWRCEKD